MRIFRAENPGVEALRSFPLYSSTPNDRAHEGARMKMLTMKVFPMPVLPMKVLQ
jgi:hypothetical protein